MTPSYPLNWAYAGGEPEAHAVIRSAPEDFIVEEIAGFEPDGEGEHLLVQVRKRGANSEWIARQLAQLAGIRPADVGFAGLKDRHALTTQWFSLPIGAQDIPAWDALAPGEAEVLQVARHRSKLRRGDLEGNRFRITLRQLVGDTAELEARLEAVAKQGVPNYFGEQRFGHDGGNLACAEAMFAGHLKERNRTKRGLYLSAARSWLFNRVLSRRVETGSWNRILPGEAALNDDSPSWFWVMQVDESVEQRLATGAIHPSGPMWGQGRSPVKGEVAKLEREALEGTESLRHGLEAAGLSQERRALRLLPQRFEWQWEGDEALCVSFSLPAGAYATSVLRELVVTRSAGPSLDRV